jgi:hypothetical protein
MAVLFVGVLISGIGSGGGGGSGRDEDGGSGAESPSGTSGDRPSSTEVPPDIDESREPVDLDAVPTGEEPTEVARWWASTYTAYIGAETPPLLSARLAPLTTPELLGQVEAVPPAASYDDGPVPIEGASSWSSPTAQQDGSHQFRITVETEDALAIYVLNLVDVGGGAGWRVAKADRL